MEKCYEEIWKPVNGQQSRIYIYGVGRVGRQLENLLVSSGYSITAFIDINATSRHYKDYKIIAPHELDKSMECGEIVIIIALTAENIAKSVKESLEIAGYKNVLLYSDRRMQEKFCLHNRGIECAQCIFVPFCQLDESKKTCKIYMADLRIVLTTRCSLNCKNCVALTPKLKKKNIVRNLKVNDFENALEVLGEHIDAINEFVLSGGDPLLNKNIGEIIGVIFKSKIRFKRISIMTPAIVPIPSELMEWLKNKEITIIIDDYGNKLKERERLILQRNIEILEKNGCNYEILDNTDGVWYDYGNFEDRKLSETEIKERFQKCSAKNCIVLTPDCYFGRCGRYMALISLSDKLLGGGEKSMLIC